MKMGLFFGSLFWGILLILVGLSLILKGFGIHLPLVKVFIAVIIILFGIKLLLGGGGRAFGAGLFEDKKETATKVEYSTVFGAQTIDLCRGRVSDKPIKINSVFSSMKVVLPSNVEFDIKPTTVFGAMVLPNVQYYGFGDDAQTLNPGASDKPVSIEANCVFGRMEFVIKKVKPPVEVTPDTTATKEDGNKF